MTLRLRFTVAAIVVTLLVTAIMFGTWRLHSEAANTRFVEASLTAKKVLWQKVVASYLEQMAPFTKTVTRDSATVNALRKQDLAALREAVQTSHNTLHQQKTIDRLQITDLNGNYLAAVPNGFTGKTNKVLIRKAVSERKLQRSVERDDDGRLMAVLAFPLYARGKLKGIAVYEKGLQEILDDFRRSDGSDIVIVSTTGEVEYAAKENLIDIPLLPDAAGTRGTLDVIQENDSYRVVITLPIQNLSGETIALLATSQDQTDTYSTQNTLILATFLIVTLTLVISAAGIYWYGKFAFKPLDQIVFTMSKIADGDLTTCTTVGGREKDETGRLTLGMYQMVNQLRTLVGEICSASEQLECASAKIIVTTECADSAAQEEVRQIQQITTAVQEMAVTVQDIAHNSERAAESARSADKQTQQGQQLVAQVGGAIDSLSGEMDRAVVAVKRLERESNNIGGILEVIRGIADQTNLLALNAAIEAARAGEQGRGFAVVADEVRTLAQRTQESTTEIHRIIESLQQGTKNIVDIMEMGHGMTKISVDHARSAESSLAAITESVDKISELNIQIASAVEEQSMMAKEISSNVTGIEQVSEDASNSVKDTAFAGSQLKIVATHLTELVTNFKL